MRSARSGERAERELQGDVMNVAIVISDSVIDSCVRSALHSHTFGVGYWAEVHETKRSVREHCPPQETGVVDDRKWLRITRQRLRIGIRLMAAAYPKRFLQLLEGNEDGPTGDLLIQLALFGEERYA